jgi:hypothetical protein
MSTTLLSVIEWVRPYVGNLYMLLDGTLEPAVSNANLILSTILSPPFCWEWNRNTTTFNCVTAENQVDYEEEISDFGFLEAADITVPTGAPTDANTIYQLQLEKKLQRSSQPGRPGQIMVFLDDQDGNITFRLGTTCPDLAYTVTLTYQKAIQPFTKLNVNIPIPDKLMHIFRYGFLALAFLYDQDPRFTEMNQKFIAALLGAQQGLDETQRNIFLGNWYQLIADEQAAIVKVQQGHQARGIM